MQDPEWHLSRLSVELIKPVPVALLTTRRDVHPARSTTRVTVDLLAGKTLVARAHALFIRGQMIDLPTDVPGWHPARLLPPPAECRDPFTVPGMSTRASFSHGGMEHRMAQGDPARPGPAAAWFRPAVPLVLGQPTSPAMRAAAAADFGSGVSWVLPADRYLFANADLNLHLLRPAAGEWIGLLSETHVHAGGIGTAVSRLYDEHGPIGLATQTLVLRERTPTSSGRHHERRCLGTMSAPPTTQLTVAAHEAEAIRTAVRTADLSLLSRAYRIAGPDHVAELIQLFADPAISDPIYDLPRPFTAAVVASWISDACERQKQGKAILAVTLDEQGKVAGYSYFTIWPERPAAELAGASRADMQGQGRGKTGAARSFGWMFEHLGVRLIGLTAAKDNVRSARVIEAAGFRPRGERQSVRPDGSIRISDYWELARDEWRTLLSDQG